MESQPQNPEFRINPENFHPCLIDFHIPVNIFSVMSGHFPRRNQYGGLTVMRAPLMAIILCQFLS